MKITRLCILFFVAYGIYMSSVIHEVRLKHLESLPTIVHNSTVENFYGDRTYEEKLQAAQSHNKIVAWIKTIDSYKLVISLYGASIFTFLVMFIYYNYITSNTLQEERF
jgi:hypothetical protein